MSQPSKDYELHRKVEQVERLVDRLDDRVIVVSNNVDEVHAGQQRTHSELLELKERFDEFIEKSQRLANVQRAETRLGTVEARLEQEFGHHKVVRRSATGTLQGYDAGLISEDVVRNLSEELMIQTPRYWLAPALVALAAWAGGDQNLTNRAVEEAFRRDPSKCSMFFALITRRQRREKSAVRWLKHFLDNQDPAALGRNFAVILEAISQGAFGQTGRDMALETLNSWRETLTANEEIVTAQKRQWWNEIHSFRTGSHDDEFPRLVADCPQWSTLDEMLSDAEAHQRLLDHYTAMMNEPFQPSTRLEDSVDDILDRLVTEFDEEELPARRELVYLKAVIDHDGDTDKAKQESELESQALGETLDYLTIQTASALYPDTIGVSRATQVFSVAACEPYLAGAHEAFTAQSRSKLPQKLQVSMQPSCKAGSAQFTLPTWTADLTGDMSALESSLGSHWDLHARQHILSLAFDKKSIWPAGLVVGGIFLLFLFTQWVPLVVLALIVGAVWGFMIWKRYKATLEDQETATHQLEEAKKEAMRNLRACGGELSDWRSAWKEADDVADKTGEFIAQLNSFSSARASFDERVVEK